MARDHARVYLSIWDDDDFRALSPAAQHLYFVLMTSPEMTYAGTTDWRPNRISKRAQAWSARGVEIAAQELSERLYVVVDTDTEEVLLRSLIRHDGLLEQPNLAVAVRKAWSSVASPALRGVIVHELNRLRKDKPELKGWPKIEQILDKPSIDPSNHPSFHPSDDPSVKGSDDPSVGDGRMGSDDPSEKGSPITAPSSNSPLLTPAPPSATTGGTTSGEERRVTLRPADATETTQKPISPADARCTAHVGVAVPPNCNGCKAARERAERLAERAAEKAQRQREEAVRNCPDCEGTHFVLDANKHPTGRKCDHPHSRTRARAS